MEKIPEVTHRIVRTKKELRALTDWLAHISSKVNEYARAFAIDTETFVPEDMKRGFKKEGLILDRGRVFMLSICHGVTSWVVPTYDYDPRFLPTDVVMAAIKPYMEDKRIRKVMHHANYDVNMFINHGVNTKNIYCTMIAGACWDETLPNGLKERCTLVGHRLKKMKHVDTTNLDAFAAYAGADAVVTWAIYMAYEKGRKIEYRGVKRDMLLKGTRRKFFKLEMRLLPYVIRMERRGFDFDTKKLAGIGTDIKKRMLEIEKRVYVKNGAPFNLGSPAQMGKFLFGKLKLIPHLKTAKGAPSCNKVALAHIRSQHKLVARIIEYSQLKALLKYTRPNGGLQDYCDHNNRIHTTFSQVAARTARSSASNPPLQQIPSKADTFGIRDCFHAPKGQVLIVGDKDQLELRLIANYSRDKMMLNAYRKNVSIHFQTAVKCGLLPPDALDKNLSKEKKEQYKKSREYGVSKSCNFGLQYRGSKHTLYRLLLLEGIDTTVEECQAIIEKYWEVYSGVPLWQEHLLDMCRTHGLARNICGRPYTFPNLDSKSYGERAASERQVINTVIQGSGADCIKYGMVFAEEDEELKEYQCRLLLQIHDELVFRAPEKYAEEATARVKTIMEMPPPDLLFPLAVPLTASVGFGPTWKTAKS